MFIVFCRGTVSSCRIGFKWDRRFETLSAFIKKTGSIFLCVALVSALVPGNIGLSAEGNALAGTGGLSNEPNDNVVLPEKDKAGRNSDGAKSEGISNEENENLGSVSGNVGTVEESKKDTYDRRTVNKGDCAKFDESNSWGKDTAIAGGAAVGVGGFVATKAAIGKMVREKSSSSTTEDLKKIKEELDDVKGKLNEVKVERDTLREQNKKFENLPGHRAWPKGDRQATDGKLMRLNMHV